MHGLIFKQMILLFIVQFPQEQSAFDIIQNRFCALKLILNVEKKNACYSQTKISSENSITLWTSQGSQIASVSEHAIDNTLRFGSHINYLRQKLMKMLGFYCRKKSCFSVDVRKKLVFSTFLMFFLIMGM